MVEMVGYKLKPRHYDFIRFYTTIGSPSYNNGSESARLAGFTAKNADRTAQDLLKNPRITCEINRINEERARAFDWTYNDWLKKGTDCFDELPSTNANKVRFWEIIGKAKEYISDSSRVTNNLYVLNSDDIDSIRKKIAGHMQKNNNVKENVPETSYNVIEVKADSTPNSNQGKDLEVIL